MNAHVDVAVGLGAISDAQRRRVEANLHLVKSAVARCGGWRCALRNNFEYNDLWQEGCMALVEAVRLHDPARHGEFAPYAISRLHFAVSRYAHERGALVRVPFVTQRRMRQQRREEEARCEERRQRGSHADAARPGEARPGRGRSRSAHSDSDRHRPDHPPRVICSEGIDQGPARRCNPFGEADADPDTPRHHPTVAELAGPRLRATLDAIRDRLVRSGGRSPLRETIIRRCFDERWTIPEADARTPIRQMARELGCSLGGITHCEARFEREAAAALDGDAMLSELRRIAKSSPQGFGHRLTAAEWSRVREMEVQTRG